MSETEQSTAGPVEEKRAEDTKPLELPAQTETAKPEEPISNEPKKAEDTKPLPLPEHLTKEENASEESTPAAAATSEEPAKETKAEAAAGEPITSGVLGYKAPGLLK